MTTLKAAARAEGSRVWSHGLVSRVVVEDGFGHPERGRVEAEPVSLGHPFTKLDDPLRKVIGAEPASELRDRRRVAGFTLRLTLP